MRLSNVIDAKVLSELSDISVELAEQRAIVEQQNILASRSNISAEDMEAIKLIWGMAYVRATDVLEMRRLQ